MAPSRRTAGPFGVRRSASWSRSRTAEGKSGLQPSRVVGIDGPRWMLRATFLGTAITDPHAFAGLVKVVRDVVVVQGDRAMAPAT